MRLARIIKKRISSPPNQDPRVTLTGRPININPQINKRGNITKRPIPIIVVKILIAD